MVRQKRSMMAIEPYRPMAPKRCWMPSAPLA
jgi:hypothetical protein